MYISSNVLFTFSMTLNYLIIQSALNQNPVCLIKVFLWTNVFKLFSHKSYILKNNILKDWRLNLKSLNLISQ